MVGRVDDDSDLEAIYQSHSATLWRSLLAYTGGRREIADDAVAEAFARALANAERIREPLSWLYRVAFRIAGAEMKRERNRVELSEVASEPAGDSLLRMLAPLRQLSPAQRAAIYLHYQADRPVSEVARLLGMSTAAVKVHLFRGRQRLREVLEADGRD
jgi:RNA polymerase sigma-70 factor (ECF subfamily)